MDCRCLPESQEGWMFPHQILGRHHCFRYIIMKNYIVITIALICISGGIYLISNIMDYSIDNGNFISFSQNQLDKIFEKNMNVKLNVDSFVETERSANGENLIIVGYDISKDHFLGAIIFNHGILVEKYDCKNRMNIWKEGKKCIDPFTVNILLKRLGSKYAVNDTQYINEDEPSSDSYRIVSPGGNYYVAWLSRIKIINASLHSIKNKNPILQFKNDLYPYTIRNSNNTVILESIYETIDNILLIYRDYDNNRLIVYQIPKKNPNSYKLLISLSQPKTILGCQNFDIKEISYDGRYFIVCIVRDPPLFGYDYLFDLKTNKYKRLGFNKFKYIYQKYPLRK